MNPWLQELIDLLCELYEQWEGHCDDLIGDIASRANTVRLNISPLSPTPQEVSDLKAQLIAMQSDPEYQTLLTQADRAAIASLVGALP